MHRRLIRSPEDLGFRMIHNTSDPNVIQAEYEQDLKVLLVAGLCFLFVSVAAICHCYWDRQQGGLAKRKLRQIPVAVYGLGADTRETECSICLGEFLDGERVRVLPDCNHGFHMPCIDKWLALHASCPNCRHSVAASHPRLAAAVTDRRGGGDMVVEGVT